jgi:RHS repeat-associated protein
VFGNTIEEWSSNSTASKSGFNGQMKDDEIYGEGNAYSAEFWEYDARLGRRWNVDPLPKPHESLYAAFANNPICFIDPDGRDTILVNKGRLNVNKLKDDKNDFDVLVNVSKREYKKGEINYNKDGELRNRHKTLNVVKDGFTYDYTKIKYSDMENRSIEVNALKITFNQKGLSNSESIYKFLVNTSNQDYEFSHIAYLDGSNNMNVNITTAYDQFMDPWGSHIITNEIITNNNNILIGAIHSHPYQPTPQDPDPRKASIYDTQFKDYVRKTQSQALFGIYFLGSLYGF